MKEILSKIVVHEKNLYLNAGFFDSLDELFISYNFYAKLLDVTERSTIRYKSIKGLAGLEFYYKFL